MAKLINLLACARGRLVRQGLPSLMALLAFVLLQFGATQLAQAQQTGADFDHASTGFVLNGQHQTVRCETCHLKGEFKGTPKDCASCHGWNNPRATFSVMPINHIPTGNSTCETCHPSNQAQFMDAVLTFNHANVRTLNCLSCHSSSNPHPNVRVNPTDATHIAVLAKNQSCEQCHTTIVFAGPKVPTNHIPTAAVSCTTCHDATDYAKMPSISVIHNYAQSTTNNCQQCHSAAAVAAYSMPTMIPPLVGPPSTHIAMNGQSCEACHVGPNSSLMTPVKDTDNFANSAFNHAGNTASCATCHGPDVTPSTFYRVSPKTSNLTPTHIPFNVGCDSCHINSVPVGQIPLTFATSGMTSFANAQFSHSGITTACETCHGPSVTSSSFFGVVPRNTGQLNPLHIPTTAKCETCHVNSIPPTPVPVSGYAGTVRFSGASFSHSGIATGCADCHGPGVLASNFYGVTSLVVMPTTAVGGHLPTSTTCESCHAGSTPTTPVSVTDSHPLGSTAFRNSPPAASLIHAGAVGTCSTCHEAGMNWLGMDLSLYKRIPSTYTKVATDLYKGFQTRPVSGGTVTSVDDAQHPVTGECSRCHGDTNAFAAWAKPTNHIPYAATASCDACHGDFSALPKVGVIHANIQSTSTGCDQCHSAAKAAYHSAGMTNSIVTLPAKHIPMGTLSCESCHVGANSSIVATPVPDDAKFGGSLFNHLNATETCAYCHGSSVVAGSFMGVLPVTISNLSPIHVPTTASCDSCHGAAPAGLVPSSGKTFANAQFSHAGITNCAACHGSDVSSTSFYGVTQIVIPQPTDAMPHIPGTGACESCHLASMPKVSVAPATTKVNGNSDFRKFPPSGVQIHSNSTGTCSSCHEADSNWIGMNLPLYDRVPNQFTTASDLYKGFHARPLSTVGVNAIVDSAHPDRNSGDCSLCHGNTTAFSQPSKPDGHIPYAAKAACGDCHVSFGLTPPTIQATHANLQSQSNNCEQCHSKENAALYSKTTTLKPIKTPADNHIPMGNLGCDKCHVGGGSDITGTPVQETAKFSKSGFLHTGISTGCGECHGPNVVVGLFDGVTPKSISNLSGKHIPVSNNVSCEICHVASIPTIQVPPTGYTGTPSFQGGQFIHTYITSGCETCHGPDVKGGDFIGVDNIVVMPKTTDLKPHIPILATCETCHAGSIPSGLMSVKVPRAIGSTGFLSSPPDTATIHTNSTSKCSDCHEPGKSWAGVQVYPPTPSTLNTKNPSQLYTGFHTRPGTKSEFSMVDNAHPLTGECSQCHGDFVAFGQPSKPTNHIPYATGASCSACHASWTLAPSITDIHANLPSAGTKCDQCHSKDNAKYYTMASRTVVGPADNHVPMRGLGCESCHVGANSSVLQIPVTGTPTFKGSAFSHSAMTSNCAECHGPNVTGFQGITSIVVMPPMTAGNHMKTSTTCEDCHSASMPSTLVPGNSAKLPSGSQFKLPAPTSGMIHAGVTGNCSDCHERGATWMSLDVAAYMTKTTPAFTGFHTRPYDGGTGYSVNDRLHPASGDCSTCHTGFAEWSANVKPANHIPTANVTCDKCHAAGQPYSLRMGNGLIHQYAPSSTTNCAQCHTATNAALYSSTTSTPVMPIVAADATTHIPMAGLGCEDCHVGSASSMVTAVADHASFSGSAFSHTGVTASCATCHDGVGASTFQGGIVPQGLSANHVGNPAKLDCGSCHVSAIPAGQVKAGSTNKTFATGQFSHNGITTKCNDCHAAGMSSSTFDGITPVVLPATTTGNHIPSPIITSCETCHLGNTPSGLVNAVATAATSAKFLAPTPPTGANIHKGVSGSCNSCHENPKTWKSITTLYPAKNANKVFTGFQTRPNGSAATATSYLDANHPSAGDCSDCHGSTENFTAAAKPGNHIPTSASAQCQNCHTDLTSGSVVNSVDTIASFNQWSAGTRMDIALIHRNAPSTLNNCAQCHGETAAKGFAIPSIGFKIKSPADTTKPHVPYGTVACETCHIYTGGPLTTTVGNTSTFAGGKFIHTGIATGCEVCHGSGYTAGKYEGITAMVAIPASSTTPGSGTHIPYSAGCEKCHLPVPSGLLSVTTAGTGFANPLVLGTAIHDNSTGITCKTCHEKGSDWLGMSTKYTRSPTGNTLSPTATSTTVYRGFQTRPNTTNFTPYGYNSPGHMGNASLETGDCSLCHAGTTQFTAEGMPAGHIKTSQACATCHKTTTPGDYSVANLDTVAKLHTGITATVTAPPTVPSTSCITCHSSSAPSSLAFAGCLTQGNCAVPPGLIYFPKGVGGNPTTSAAGAVRHVPIASLDCVACHGSVTTFAATTMGTKGHTNAENTGKIDCQSCHLDETATMKNSTGGVTTNFGADWTNTSPPRRKSGKHNGTPARLYPNDCNNSGCHSYTKGFRAIPRPIMREALVSPNMGRIKPTTKVGKPTRGSLGNNFDHTGVEAGKCKDCHDGKSASGMPARHLMVATSCDTCHRPTTWLPAQFNHNGITPNTCLACHNGMGASNKPSGHFMTARSCDSCHKNMTWTPVNYQHMSPLYKASPDKLTCVSCHDTNGEIIRRQARALTRTKPIPVGP